jgi:hypothetical protein
LELFFSAATIMTHIDVHADKPLFVDVLTAEFTPQKYIQWLLATQMVSINAILSGYQQ